MRAERDRQEEGVPTYPSSCQSPFKQRDRIGLLKFPVFEGDWRLICQHSICIIIVRY